MANHELSQKTIKTEKVSAANNNPYFYDIVESMQMKSMLRYAIENHSPENIALFTRWAESFLPKEPSAQLFIFLAMAYQELEQLDEMCQTLSLGQSIYPNDESLLSGVEHCDK